MSRKGGRADPRVERTVAYLLRCPRSTVPEAMCASKFSLAESSSHPTKQMAVRRAYGKASGGKTKPPPTNLVETSTAGTSTVSPLTNSPQRQQAASSQISTPRRSPGGSQSPKSKPKPRLIRRNSRAIDSTVQARTLGVWRRRSRQWVGTLVGIRVGVFASTLS
jgi:hypothetical protein